MLPKHHISLILFFLLQGSVGVFGQTDSVLQMEVIEIQADRARKSHVGGQSQTWTEKQLQALQLGSMAELLDVQSGAFIKSYGLGALATSSVRGSNASQSLVLWNGFPLQNPMLGQLDLSLLPLSGSERISFQKGGGSALWGSGAIGGLISMENQASFEPILSVQSLTLPGSFGRFRQESRLRIGNKNFQSQSKWLVNRAENDFPYEISPDLPLRRQSNARLRQQNFFQDFFWRPQKGSQLKLHLWRQDSYREIPPTIYQKNNADFQEDEASRLMLEGEKLLSSSLLIAKAAYYHEKLNFFDPDIRLSSLSEFRTFMAEAGAQFHPAKGQQLHLGSTFSQTRVQASAYHEVPLESRWAAFASWKGETKKLRWQSSLRQEWVNRLPIPLIPSLGIDYQLHPLLLLSFKASRNYRVPTFNDRYWPGGGNPDLKPESGWSQEGSLTSNWEGENRKLEISLTGFNRVIDNWILWSLLEGQSFWSANNITKVWSRGLEPRILLKQKLGDASLELQGGYDLVLSTNEIKLERPRMAKGEQLLYSPRHRAFGQLSLKRRALFLAYQFNFTGSRRGISEALPPFSLSHIQASYAIKWKDYLGKLMCRINNLGNSRYFVVEQRPMPGIHLEGGINIDLTKTIKTKLKKE